MVCLHWLKNITLNKYILLWLIWLLNFLIKDTANINNEEDLELYKTVEDENGNVKKDYEGAIFMMVPEINDLQDVNLPEDWIYTFQKSDYGTITFSKTLSFRVNGYYTFNVSDEDNLNIFWVKNIKIWDGIEVIGDDMIEWLYENW